MNSTSFAIGNVHLERRFRVDDGVFGTVSLQNRHSGTELRVQSAEFVIHFLSGHAVRGSEFRYCEHSVTETADAGTLLSVRLRHDATGLRVEVEYILQKDDFYARKRLLVASTQAGGARIIDRVDVEAFSSDTAATTTVEYQPVFIGTEFFVGLEYPAGVNSADRGDVCLTHFPGVSLTDSPWCSKRAVLGVRCGHDLQTDFCTYIGRIRRRNPCCLIWNSGGDVQIYDPVQLPKQARHLEGVLDDAVNHLQSELTRKRGLCVDFFTLDAGWQDPDTLYDVNRGKFPDGLTGFTKRVQATAGSRLGLWLSTTTPVTPTQLSEDVLRRHGYELAANPDRGTAYPCLSYPPYFADIKQTMRRHVTELNVGFYKMDFEYFECAAPDHAHLPNRRHGREANVDALIELMTELSDLCPDIRLRPTSGMWLSPWWLTVADVIWPQGMMDFNYGRGPVSTSARDWELTLRDQEFHRLLRVESGCFPLSGMLFMGMGAGPRYNVAGPNEGTESFLASAVYGIARQLTCPERQISIPPSRSATAWDTLAAATVWGLDRHGSVPEGRMILGEPQTGAVYGFSYLDRDGGIVVLRNPGMRPQETTVPVAGLHETTEFLAQVTYPHRRFLGRGSRGQLAHDLRLRLGPSAVAVVEIRPVPLWHRPVLSGCRYALVQSSPEASVFDVCGEPGEAVAFQVVAGAKVVSCTADGRPVPVDGGRVSLAAKGRRQRLHVERLPPRMAKGAPTELEMTRLDIPDAHQATVRILTSGEAPHPLRISVNMGGWFGGLPYRFCAGDGWAAYDLELNPRDMNIIAWGFPEQDAPDNATMWLLRRWDLARTRVRIVHEQTPPSALRPELSTPFAHVVHDALCVSDLPSHRGVDSVPWTDEYAGSSGPAAKGG